MYIYKVAGDGVKMAGVKVEEVKGCVDDRKGVSDKDIITRSVTSTPSMKSLATSQPLTGIQI
jgi:hypothetical protein